MFKFRCMHCDQKIAVPTEFAGRHVRCPGCAQSTIVPFPSPEELAAAEEVGFHVRPAPSIVLASRTCKSCGAVMPQTGPCISCGAKPNGTLKVAFDASIVTMLDAAESPIDPKSSTRRGARVWLAAVGAAGLVAVLVIAYLMLQ